MDNEKRNSFFSFNTPGGLLVGVIFAATSFTTFKSGSPIYMNHVLDNILLMLYVFGLTLQIRRYRDEVLNGYITYGTGLKTGVYVGAIAGIIYGIYIYMIYSTYPELLEHYQLSTETTLREVYGSNSMIENIVSMVKVFTTPLTLAFSECFSKVVGGFFYCLFIAWFLRRQPRNV